MRHGEIAVRLADMLNRAGYLFLGHGSGTVTAQIRIVRRDCSRIRLTVDGEKFTLVVRCRKRCSPPVCLKFPNLS
jgi:hypothetical protein